MSSYLLYLIIDTFHMKKLFYTLILLPLINYAQCIISHLHGNTGSNICHVDK